MFKYDKLFDMMERKNVTMYTLAFKDNIVGHGAFPRIKSGKNIDFNTLDRLCNYFGCQPNDLIEFVPDELAS